MGCYCIRESKEDFIGIKVILLNSFFTLNQHLKLVLMRIKLFLYCSLLFERTNGMLKFFFLRLLGCNICKDGSLRIGRNSSITLFTQKSVLLIGKNCYFRKFCSVVVSDGRLKIGDNFFMNNHSSLNCMGEIEIGDNCLFGESVKLYDHNYDYRKNDGLPFNKKGHRRGKISIGHNCWLGSNCVVLMGVTIGDNVIVGANTVVHKDIPSGTILVNKQDWQFRENAG